MIKGIRAHDVEKEGLKDATKRCKELGISTVQLVLKKSITEFSCDEFSSEKAEKIKSMLNGLDVAVLGAYINPSTADGEMLVKQMDFFKEQILYAKALGAEMIGTETGFYGETMDRVVDSSEEVYRYLLKNMRELLSECEREGVNLGIEGVHCFVINTPEKMHRLVNDLNSERVKVIFDPVNYLTEKNYMLQNEIINSCFELLHEKIGAVHAKDFKPEEGKLVSVLPGEGMLNYSLIFEKLKEYNLDIPIILEGVRDIEAEFAFKNIAEI